MRCAEKIYTIVNHLKGLGKIFEEKEIKLKQKEEELKNHGHEEDKLQTELKKLQKLKEFNLPW